MSYNPIFWYSYSLTLALWSHAYRRFSSRPLFRARRYFAESVRDDYANGQLDSQVETILQEMKDLSIYNNGA